MIRVRTVVLAVGLVAVLGALAGTGGVSSTAADRGMQVEVVDDDDAYLGFEQDARTTNETTNLTVTIENRFAGVTLSSVDVTVEGETTDLGPVDPGDAESVTFVDVDCDGSVAVDAAGDGVRVTLDREECD